MNDKVLPILKKQQGFLDEIVLASTSDPDHLLAQSFWKSREDAERYNRDQFPKIREMSSLITRRAGWGSPFAAAKFVRSLRRDGNRANTIARAATLCKRKTLVSNSD